MKICGQAIFNVAEVKGVDASKMKIWTDLFCYKKLFEFAFMFCGHFSSGSGLKSRIESELKLDTGCLPNVF